MKPSKKQSALAEKILQTDDKDILNYIEWILNNNSAEWEEELPDEVRESIERGLKDADEGRVIPHSEVRKRYKSWLRK